MLPCTLQSPPVHVCVKSKYFFVFFFLGGVRLLAHQLVAGFAEAAMGFCSPSKDGAGAVGAHGSAELSVLGKEAAAGDGVLSNALARGWNEPSDSPSGERNPNCQGDDF